MFCSGSHRLRSNTGKNSWLYKPHKWRVSCVRRRVVHGGRKVSEISDYSLNYWINQAVCVRSTSEKKLVRYCPGYERIWYGIFIWKLPRKWLSPCLDTDVGGIKRCGSDHVTWHAAAATVGIFRGGWFCALEIETPISVCLQKPSRTAINLKRTSLLVGVNLVPWLSWYP